MSVRLKLYPIVSRVAAAVLLLAGVLKAHQELTSSAPESPSVTNLVSATVELLLGLWLLVGWYPRWCRLAAVALFVVFFNVAFMRMFQNQPSCGCFGSFPVQTLGIAILDAVMVLALLVNSPLLESRPPAGGAGLRLGLGSLSIVALLGLIGWQAVIALPTRPPRRPTDADRHALLDQLAPSTEKSPAKINALIERVIDGVKRNREAFQSLECTLDVTLTTYPVPLKLAPDAPEQERKGEGAKATPKTQHLVMKSLLHGDDLRRDCDTNLSDFDARETRINAGGKHILYLPELRQAWLSEAASAETPQTETIDPRCAGFHPPIHGIAEWLQRAELLESSVRPNGASGELVHLRVLAFGPAGRAEVRLDCASAMNYMPVRVVYNFPGEESIFTGADLEYRKVDAASAWFPKRWKSRSFTPGVTKDPNAATGFDLLAEAEVRSLSVNADVSADAFDPILPPNTRLVGNLAAQPQTGDTPVRASAVMRTEPSKSVPPAPADLSPWLWVLGGIDAAAAGLCLLFRRDLVL